MKLAALSLMALVLLAGCERLMHDMYDQPRYRPMQKSALFPDGTSARPPVAVTVPAASGVLAGTSSGRIGAQYEREKARAEAAEKIPYPITLPLLQRGQQRFDIYCSPCHSVVGDGDGMVVRRGFPAPPSYYTERLVNAPDRHFYDVMTQGYGIMRPYAAQIEPADRWAIVAYIRALQLTRNAAAQPARR